MLFALNKMNTRNKGFTLFELLVSISIIGIMTALAVMSYSGSQVRARNARRVEDMSMIQKAAEQYYAGHSYSYPASSNAFYTGTDKVMEAWPTDPKGAAPYVYTYTLGVPVPGTYCACAFMEGTNMGNSTVACGNFVNPATKNYYCVKGQQE